MRWLYPVMATSMPVFGAFISDASCRRRHRRHGDQSSPSCSHRPRFRFPRAIVESAWTNRLSSSATPAFRRTTAGGARGARASIIAHCTRRFGRDPAQTRGRTRDDRRDRRHRHRARPGRTAEFRLRPGCRSNGRRCAIARGYSWLEPSVEEGVVHGFAVGREHHSHETSFRFRYGCPATNSAGGLHAFAQRRSDGVLNPLALDGWWRIKRLPRDRSSRPASGA